MKMIILPFLYLIFSITNIDCLMYKVCDGNRVQIYCPSGTTLRIENTYYCSEDFSLDFCSDSVEKNCCKPDLSYYVVSKLDFSPCPRIVILVAIFSRCDYQECCVFPCASYMFAGSCPIGRKCLILDYSCEPDDSSSAERCRINEEWSDCRSACPEMCPDLNNTQPNFCTDECVCAGWQCKPGYIRDYWTGICLKRKFCPKPGDRHEIFTRCANKQCYCKIWSKPPQEGTTVSTTTKIIRNTCCEPGYKCRRPYIRDPLSGCCVEPKNCPIFKG